MGNRLVIQSTGSSDVLKIRAHHLLCMQGFQGYGYSRDFEGNLQKIIKYLDSNPHCRLKVVADADMICLKCPHLEDNHCNRSPSSIVDMDLKVLKKLDIEEGATKTAQKLFREINEILDPDDFHDICGECSWKDKCLLYQSKIRLT